MPVNISKIWYKNYEKCAKIASMSTNHYRLIILGSGPAGCTAAIYASRANIELALVTGAEQGGQLVRTSNIDNWPGDYTGVSGVDLMGRMLKHCGRFTKNVIFDNINKADLGQRPFLLSGDASSYSCDALIVATGASPKYLGLPEEKEFLGNGLSTCATCDGFFYKKARVAVVGGGNTAIEDAIYLAGIAAKVFIVHRRDALRADKILLDKLQELVEQGKIEMRWNRTVSKILGDSSGVKGMQLLDVVSQKTEDLEVNGLFLAVGNSPNIGIFDGQLELEEGYIKINAGRNGDFTATSVSGVFAAGDVANRFYRQAITAAAMGCMAATDVQKFLLV
jgi:thioredoxin reductase (NADPH)